ncbi:unnamed protein product [Soboliphyme baturini]|uniref:Uncharacterized protein n=1 Tax=Soboliphyme baturini TaxID=241478 RepID=A0A183JA03_9BILA|nr:unnamed protein product [Soboliphyme baturini]
MQISCQSRSINRRVSREQVSDDPQFSDEVDVEETHERTVDVDVSLKPQLSYRLAVDRRFKMHQDAELMLN